MVPLQRPKLVVAMVSAAVRNGKEEGGALCLRRFERRSSVGAVPLRPWQALTTWMGILRSQPRLWYGRRDSGIHLWLSSHGWALRSLSHDTWFVGVVFQDVTCCQSPAAESSTRAIKRTTTLKERKHASKKKSSNEKTAKKRREATTTKENRKQEKKNKTERIEWESTHQNLADAATVLRLLRRLGSILFCFVLVFRINSTNDPKFMRQTVLPPLAGIMFTKPHSLFTGFTLRVTTMETNLWRLLSERLLHILFSFINLVLLQSDTQRCSLEQRNTLRYIKSRNV